MMTHEPKPSSALRPIVFIAAVALAIAAFSGALATKTEPAPQVAPIAEVQTGTHQDPSLAGLSIGPDAEPGGDVEMYH
jgi:hypothetical protein